MRLRARKTVQKGCTSMRFDMHCHTKEGSLDAKADVAALAERLQRQGFGGMMVSDHNSYRAFRSAGMEQAEALPNFTVLRGIEYDTRDAGHILVLLPDGVSSRLLELRGMRVDNLIRLVHGLGGVLGPAHPYGTGFFALMHTRWAQRHFRVLEPFDFVETQNAGLSARDNERAAFLARHFGKPQLGGSDAHRLQAAGAAYTDFLVSVHCNNDAIAAIRAGRVSAGCSASRAEAHRENAALKWLGIVGYWSWNKASALWRRRARRAARRRLERRRALYGILSPREKLAGQCAGDDKNAKL